MRVEEDEREHGEQRADFGVGRSKWRTAVASAQQHHRDAEEELEEPVDEQDVDEQRDDEEAEPLVLAERAEERAQREHGAAEVGRDEDDVRGDERR